MKIVIDLDAKTTTTQQGDVEAVHSLYSPESFALLSRHWMRVGWSLAYYHRFQWMGLPILQLPEDLIRLQEVLFRLRPDVIVETGIFGGGSLLFAASICEALGNGRVIGIEKYLRDDTRNALSAHRLAHRFSVIEGDSAAPETVQAVRQLIKPTDSVFVILDSDHSTNHVLRELEAYGPLVTPGSCLLAEDAVMKDLADLPRADASWSVDNPGTAIDQFMGTHPEFRREAPQLPFNESSISYSATFWPGGWLWKS